MCIMNTWCKNVLTIRSKQGGVLECLAAIRRESDNEGRVPLIDFNRIVPMPKVLEDTVSHPDLRGLFLVGDQEAGRQLLLRPWALQEGIATLEALRHYLERQEDYEELLARGRRAREAQRMTGFDDRRAWCLVHWGTQFPAHRTSFQGPATDQKASLEFLTYLRPPCRVIEVLSARFYDLSFTLRYREPLQGLKGILHLRNGIPLWNERLPLRRACGG